MERSSANPHDEEAIPREILLFAAMLGGTIVGQLSGIALDVLVGSRGLAIPFACSVALEGVVAARVAARSGRPLARRDCWRVSVTYSLGLFATTFVLAVWIHAAHSADASNSAGARALAGWTAPGVLWLVVALATATLVRSCLMAIFQGSRR